MFTPPPLLPCQPEHKVVLPVSQGPVLSPTVLSSTSATVSATASYGSWVIYRPVFFLVSCALHLVACECVSNTFGVYFRKIKSLRIHQCLSFNFVSLQIWPAHRLVCPQLFWPPLLIACTRRVFATASASRLGSVLRTVLASTSAGMPASV